MSQNAQSPSIIIDYFLRSPEQDLEKLASLPQLASRKVIWIKTPLLSNNQGFTTTLNALAQKALDIWPRWHDPAISQRLAKLSWPLTDSDKESLSEIVKLNPKITLMWLNAVVEKVFQGELPILGRKGSPRSDIWQLALAIGRELDLLAYYVEWDCQSLEPVGWKRAINIIRRLIKVDTVVFLPNYFAEPPLANLLANKAQALTNPAKRKPLIPTLIDPAPTDQTLNDPTPIDPTSSEPTTPSDLAEDLNKEAASQESESLTPDQDAPYSSPPTSVHSPVPSSPYNSAPEESQEGLATLGRLLAVSARPTGGWPNFVAEKLAQNEILRDLFTANARLGVMDKQPVIADFLGPNNLAVIIDTFNPNPAPADFSWDKRFDFYLLSRGYRILRIADRELATEPETALAIISELAAPTKETTWIKNNYSAKGQPQPNSRPEQVLGAFITRHKKLKDLFYFNKYIFIEDHRSNATVFWPNGALVVDIDQMPKTQKWEKFQAERQRERIYARAGLTICHLTDVEILHTPNEAIKKLNFLVDLIIKRLIS
ncbi:MAG: hypothetical protein LBT38_12620 [Deltaproteobacteria bacterium]|jgi:hypothetical protein|nr:hypothetical protein [Deltaproteobacteria bacterium]